MSPEESFIALFKLFTKPKFLLLEITLTDKYFGHFSMVFLFFQSSIRRTVVYNNDLR